MNEKREIKQRFTLTEHRAPWLLTPGGSLTSGAHYRVCCQICHSHQLKGLLRNPVPLHPKAPYLCLFWWLSGPHIQPTLGPLSVLTEKGQLLIGYRC